MSFAVTALPHSGTTWLARVLAASRDHEVWHEHAGDASLCTKTGFYERVAGRFRGRDRYGEVSALLRFVLDDLPADRKAVIVRDPAEVMLSSVNRDPERYAIKRFTRMVEELEQGLRLLDRSAKNGVKVVRMDRITTDRAALAALIDHLGVPDVSADDVDLTPMNACAKQHWPTIASMGAKRANIVASMKWFKERYCI